MSLELRIVEVHGSQGVELILPPDWNAQNMTLFDNAGMSTTIADSTKRQCPLGQSCEAGGYIMREGGKLVLAAATCQIETCPIGR